MCPRVERRPSRPFQRNLRQEGALVHVVTHAGVCLEAWETRRLGLINSPLHVEDHTFLLSFVIDNSLLEETSP